MTCFNTNVHISWIFNVLDNLFGGVLAMTALISAIGKVHPARSRGVRNRSAIGARRRFVSYE